MTATYTTRPVAPVTDRRVRADAVAAPTVLGRVLAVSRIVLGFVFLWAFLDKAFGLHYSTASGKAWIDGGSPTKGFLSHVEVGPLQSFFRDIAGNAFVDWLFMLGLLGVGVALIVGVGLRAAAIAGVPMMLLMWAAEWPLAQHTSSGAASGSVNPIIDYHIIYALLLVVFAVTAAARTYGLANLPVIGRIVDRAPWLR